MDLDLLFAAPIGALLIFLLRIVDVAMALIRMLVAVQGQRVLAAVIGFFEVLLWLVAVGQALQHLDSWLHIVGYAGGFAMGNYVGVWLEGKFALGLSVVRGVVRDAETVHSEEAGRAGDAAAEALRGDGYTVTTIDGHGRDGRVVIINVVVPRRKVPLLIARMEALVPSVFVTVQEIRSTVGGRVRIGGRKQPVLGK